MPLPIVLMWHQSFEDEDYAGRRSCIHENLVMILEVLNADDRSFFSVRLLAKEL